MFFQKQKFIYEIIIFVLTWVSPFITNIRCTVLQKYHLCNLPHFQKCYPWGPTVYVHLVQTYGYLSIQGHIIHFFSLDKKGNIEQGFIVQGPTLTRTHETGTHGHNNLILAPSRTLKGQDALKFRSESSIKTDRQTAY